MPSDPLSVARHFADLPDPRVDRTTKHALGDILVIALAAVVCGASAWEDIEEFGRAKEPLFRRFLALPNGIPSHDTFGRVFAALDPRKFADCFGRWMAAVCEATGLVHKLSTGRRPGGRPGARSAGACTWSARGRPGTGRSPALRRCLSTPTRSRLSPSCCRPWTWRGRW